MGCAAEVRRIVTLLLPPAVCVLATPRCVVDHADTEGRHGRSSRRPTGFRRDHTPRARSVGQSSATPDAVRQAPIAPAAQGTTAYDRTVLQSLKPSRMLSPSQMTNATGSDRKAQRMNPLKALLPDGRERRLTAAAPGPRRLAGRRPSWRRPRSSCPCCYAGCSVSWLTRAVPAPGHQRERNR